MKNRYFHYLVPFALGTLASVLLIWLFTALGFDKNTPGLDRVFTPNELIQFSSGLQKPVKVIGYASQITEILEPVSMEFFTATINGEDGGVVIISMQGKKLRDQLVMANKSLLIFHGKYGGWSFEHGVPFIWASRFEIVANQGQVPVSNKTE